MGLTCEGNYNISYSLEDEANKSPVVGVVDVLTVRVLSFSTTPVPNIVWLEAEVENGKDRVVCVLGSYLRRVGSGGSRGK